MKSRHHCIHCHEEIEKTDRAACGWQHLENGQVICRLTDATPMDAVQEIVYAGMILPTPFLAMLGKQ